MSTRAIITGITGEDGSYLAELLLAHGYEVHGIIRRASTFNTCRIDHIYEDRQNPNVRPDMKVAVEEKTIYPQNVDDHANKEGYENLYGIKGRTRTRWNFVRRCVWIWPDRPFHISEQKADTEIYSPVGPEP